eukprot:TRINITY_DN15543_c0_g1_i2.p1 TRINITY_DN15543_c0_g1~~TRINITY_DN15543_c0_g1_i2.p1  ORF type:complete len:308 (+),score=124.90 TRINITY_DN15543_c0_g1_i2:690-1613(+)
MRRSRPAPASPPPRERGQCSSATDGAELDAVKAKLATAVKMQGVQAKLINTLKEKEKEEATKMKKLWQEERKRWEGKELEWRSKLSEAESQAAAENPESTKLREVQELLEMLQAEAKDNDKIKENLKMKAEENLIIERAKLTRQKEQDQAAFEAKEAELVAQVEKEREGRKQDGIEAAAVLTRETSKISELWRKDKVAWEHKEESCISALRTLQHKLILKDEQLEEAERQIFAWEEDFAANLEEHREEMDEMQREHQRLVDAHDKLEASNQHLIELWWRGREQAEPYRSQQRDVTVARMLEDARFEI